MIRKGYARKKRDQDLPKLRNSKFSKSSKVSLLIVSSWLWCKKIIFSRSRYWKFPLWMLLIEQFQAPKTSRFGYFLKVSSGRKSIFLLLPNVIAWTFSCRGDEILKYGVSILFSPSMSHVNNFPRFSQLVISNFSQGISLIPLAHVINVNAKIMSFIIIFRVSAILHFWFINMNWCDN